MAVKKNVKQTATQKKSPAKIKQAAKPAAKPAAKKVAKPAAVPAVKQAPAKSHQKKLFEPGIEAMGIAPYKPAKGEDYMSPEMCEHFNEILKLWKQQLMEEVDRTVHHMQDDAANYPDIIDRAAQEEEFRLELRARDRERRLIKKIEEAIQTIQRQEYGYCEACGAEIGLKRLEARPTATLCIDCKTLDEIREKQQG